MGATAAAEPAHNLPQPLTSLVGRTRELRAIADTLHRTRLVTIAGPGGVGKTRVALDVARRQLAARADGVWLVDLAAGPGAPDVVVDTARVLDVRGPRGTTAISELKRYLAHRELLIVLDNCEHVVEQCAELAAAILSACRGVAILATSRESLGVTGETVWRLEPLEPYDARRLFVERARQRDPQYIPDSEADASIDRLCARLDRLPLAIELAAARVGAMSPVEILAALDVEPALLSGATRRSPGHHRTVRMAVQWSYRLLGARDQRAFRHLAVFSGGFDAQSAVAVAPGLSLAGVAGLVDKSLVAVVETPRERTRYRLLETIRDFALQMLDDAGELDAGRARQLDHFARLAGLASAEWRSTGAHRFVNELDDDFDNVRAVLEWAADRDPCGGLRVFAGTRDLFFRFGQAEGVRLADLLLTRCPARDDHRLEALIGAGHLAITIGDFTAARAALAEAAALAEELGEPVLQAWTRFFQGVAETLSGAFDAGRAHLEASHALHRERGLRIGEARALAVLGMGLLMSGEPALAKDRLERALAACVEAQDRWGQGQCHTFLGMIAATATSQPRTATAHYREAVDCLRASRDATLLPVALLGQAGVLARRDPERALAVASAAVELRARVGGEFPPYFLKLLDTIRAAGDAALGDGAARAWARGAGAGIDDSVAIAFGAPKPPAASPTGLSVRELEVARLVANGLSNKAVAAQLTLSVRTVESHVRHVLAKVGLTNRTQLSTWVRDHAQ